MLEVLVLHGLAQERQGAAGFPAAVPNLSMESPVRWMGKGGAQGPQAQPSLHPAITLMGMARRFSRKDWKRKVRG